MQSTKKILSRDNMNAAHKRVYANKGAGGVDGVTVEQLGDYIKENCESIRGANQVKEIQKELTCRKMLGTVTSRIAQINQVTRGQINYYALGSMKTVMTEIDAHLRTRLRIIIWKQWKVPQKRQWGLQKQRIGKDLARADIVLWRPLLLSCHKDACGQGNL